MSEESTVTPIVNESETVQEEVVFTPEVEEEGKVDEFPGLDENQDETKELTEEEKHELFIQMLKESKIKFRPVKHPVVNGVVVSNVVKSKFGVPHKKERKRKNRQQNKSRKANR